MLFHCHQKKTNRCRENQKSRGNDNFKYDGVSAHNVVSLFNGLLGFCISACADQIKTAGPR